MQARLTTVMKRVGGVIVGCSTVSDSSQYDDSESIGIRFARRMEDQCQQVERYRQKVMQCEGRQLSPDEAALEWIEYYAKAYAEEPTGDEKISSV